VYSQATKGIVEEEAGIFYMEKGVGILWRKEYASPRHTSARERIDNEGDGALLIGSKCS